MALTKKEAAGNNKFEIGFSVDKETFDSAVSDVFNKKKGSITVPGFRRGKAPRHIVEQMYGKGVFYEDALNDVLPDAYEAAVKEAGLEVVGKPKRILVFAIVIEAYGAGQLATFLLNGHLR